jgi:hypothetical protein
MNSGVSVNPVAQWAVRNKRYKLVELLKTNCAAPLPPNATNKPFPWAEYDTQTSREFYDLRKTQGNPTGVDFADNNLLRDCPAGQDPKTCLEGPLRRNYTQLSNTLASVRGSGDAQATCMSKGDGNLDLRVNNADVRAWRVLNGKGPSQYDINRDAETNEDDLAIIQANLGADCMDVCARADLNRDGKVERRDMSLLSKQSGACDEVMCGGDLDGNGAVNNRDVNLMINAQNTCTP